MLGRQFNLFGIAAAVTFGLAGLYHVVAAAIVENAIIVDEGVFVFEKPDLKITAGDTVKWVPASGTHLLEPTQDNPDAFPPTQSFNKNNPQSLTFNTAGVIKYFCRFHPDTMQGTITVASGDAAN